LLIDVTELREGGVWRRAPGRLQAHVGGTLATSRVDDWRLGRAVTMPATFRRPHLLRNPGESRPLWQRLRQPFDVVGSIKSGALVDVMPGPWWTEAPAAVRARVRAVVARYVAPQDPQAAAVVIALLIGDRAGLADRSERRLQAAGTYHTIAISGGNVAILTALCFAVCRLLFRSAGIAIAVAMAVVVAYGAVVGPQPSVTRAILAAVGYMALASRGLVPRPLHALTTVAFVVAVADPLTTMNVGAWLSFGATAGILLGATRLAPWLGRRIVGDPAPHEPTVHRVGRGLVALLAATIAAELALLPVSASTFARVGVAGLALNFVAIPAMTVAQLAGLLLVATDGWPFLAGTFASLASAAAGLLLDSAVLVDAWPWTTWRVPPVSMRWTVAYFASLCVSLAAVGHRRLRRAAMVSAIASGLVIVTAPTVELAAPSTRLRVTMIDVGQGDAVLAQFPTGRSLLVDAGGSSGGFDIGGRVVTPALWALGVRRLNWLAISHPDLDHIGGALAVLRDFEPGEIWEGVPVPPNPEWSALRQAARDAGVSWRSLRVGDEIAVGDVVIQVQHPPRPEWERQRTRNDDSLVLRLTMGSVELLLTGDVGAEYEASSSPNPDRRGLRVLKVAHHGSRTSSSPTFLDALRPDIALVSVGRANLFGHPASDVMARLEQRQTTIFRTDQDGAVILDTDGTRIEVRTMTGQRWTLW
jgi:competence protein ComEC